MLICSALEFVQGEADDLTKNVLEGLISGGCALLHPHGRRLSLEVPGYLWLHQTKAPRDRQNGKVERLGDVGGGGGALHGAGSVLMPLIPHFGSMARWGNPGA